MFFWKTDLKHISTVGMDGLLPPLGKVTFHAKIGNELERLKRMEGIASAIAPIAGAHPEQAARAALLSKADLTTSLVYEFPELQGVIGGIYARAASEDPSVAAAIEDHYRPVGPDDAVPAEPVAVCVALADKLDRLINFWAINEQPTSSKDPYGLRRAALGVARLIVENDLHLPLTSLGVTSGLLHFIHLRFVVWMKGSGYRDDVIKAVVDLGDGNDDLLATFERVNKLSELMESEVGKAIAISVKRVCNILDAAEKNGGPVSDLVDSQLFGSTCEHALHDALVRASCMVADLSTGAGYAQALKAVGNLQDPVDGFFDGVMVNADDVSIRENRLGLLAAVRSVAVKTAAWSNIQV